MMITQGSIDQSLTIHLSDTDGGDATGLDHTDITIQYRRGGDGSLVTDTSVELATLGTAHTDWGVREISSGNFRVDLPDAAWATGVDHLEVFLSATGAVQTRGAEVIQLVELPLTYAGIRTALGMASANLDTQLDAIPTAAEIEAALVNEGDATALLQAIADKIAGDLTVGDLTTQAIATACRDAILDRVLIGNHITASTVGLLLQNLDAAITSRLPSGAYSVPLDAAGTRTALGLASANLDTQLGAIPTAAPLDAAGTRSALGLASANLDTQLAAISTALGDDLAVNGTVNDASATTSSFTAAGLPLDASAYAGQLLIFTQGDLLGITRKIAQASTGTTIALTKPLPEAPANTTTFVIGGKG